MDTPSLGQRLGAELMGTFLFFFMGFSGIAVAVDLGPDAISGLAIAAGFGFGLALAITAFGHISGGHYNPAVTAGLTVAGKHDPKDVLPYWVAQMVGGFLAVLVVRATFSGDATDVLDTTPGVDDWKALVLEMVATGLFLMVILTVATDEGAPWNGVMAPLLICLFIFTAANVVGPASGGSFNPARSIAPVILNADWGDIWIYVLGPLVGAVLGASVWSSLRRA